MNEMNIVYPECISQVEHSFFITDLTPLSGIILIQFITLLSLIMQFVIIATVLFGG